MQPFELPEFYMPYPARCNPNVETARVHTKAWAYQMDMIDVPQDGVAIWDEHDLDAHDYALLCAYTHPDAPARRSPWSPTGTCGSSSSTTTSWRLFKRTQDRRRAARPTSTGCRFHADGPGELTVPEPANPVEAGLADLWTRTVPSMSADWRAALRREHRAPAQRVAVGAVQHQRGPGRQPRRVHRDAPQGRRRPLVGRTRRVRRRRRSARRDRRQQAAARAADTFSDAVHLRNDLFSYQREVEEEGELSNGVLVLETFLGCTTQEAADAVNDLLTSRLHQFEHTALTEVPAAAARDTASTRPGLRRRRRLRQGAAGLAVRRPRVAPALQPLHERRRRRRPATPRRARRPDRPRHLGAPTSRPPRRVRAPSAARTTRTCRSSRSAPSRLPDFYMPFERRAQPAPGRRPAADSSTGRARWACWTRSPACPVPDSGTRTSSPPTTSPLCAAGIDPDADPRSSSTSARRWLTWGTYGDDYYPLVFGRPRDLAGARLCNAAAVGLHAASTASRSPSRPTRWNAASPTCGHARPRAR